MSKIKKFGTFSGVFTPSILTILGVIMYLRFPTIIGQAGLINTIGIIVIAHIISITTSLSVASLSTDKTVKTGGTYFMISRSLGLSIGGTLGFALFVGLSFSVSLYLIGFAESFLSYWNLDTSINSVRITGTIILILVTTVTFISTSLAIKSQYFIMAAIGLSLLSIFFGHHEFAPTQINLKPMADAAPFMILFGIFFPAVTGFEAGVSMSGDLENPKKSLPVGAMAAVGVGFVVYIGLALFYAFTVDAEVLRNDSQVLFKISLVPALVIIGIWGATLSSALGSILGAPRILQAIAMDKIAPKIFAKGTGKTNEPRNALLLAFVIAEAGILIGELDVIARIVSMFFITTYAFLNLASAIESWSSSDFRPAFKIPRFVSILGAVSAFIVMILLDFIALAGAVIVLGLLFFYLRRKELVLESGDAWSSFWTNLAKQALLKLTNQKAENRNWRPNIILFRGGQQSRLHLVELGLAMSGKLGALTDFELVIEPGAKIQPGAIKKQTKTNEVNQFFTRKYVCDSVENGIKSVTSVYGFSGFEPNTAMMGWSRDPKNVGIITNILSDLKKKNMNAVLLDYDKNAGFGKKENIDIWWNGKGRFLSFALNLMRFILADANWRDANIRILVINNDNKRTEKLYRNTKTLLEEKRILAEVKIISDDFGTRTKEMIINSESANADLVVVGISSGTGSEANKKFESINQIADLHCSLLILSPSSEFEEINIIDQVLKTKAIETSGVATLELTPIPLIESKLIRARIEKTDLDFMELAQGFIDKTLEAAVQHQLSFVKSVRDFFEINIKQTEKTIGNLKGVQLSKMVNKNHQAFLVFSTNLFDKHGGQIITEIKEILEIEIANNKRKFENYITESPETIMVSTIRKGSGKEKNISIPYQKIISASLHKILVPGMLMHLKNYENNTSKLYAQLTGIILKINDVYEKRNVNNKTFEADLRREKEQILEDFKALEQMLQDQIGKCKTDLLNALRNEVIEIRSDLTDSEPRKRVKERLKTKIVSQFENLEVFAEDWVSNSRIINNAAILDCRILSEQKIIYGIVQNFTEKVNSIVAENVIAPIDVIRNTIEYWEIGNSADIKIPVFGEHIEVRSMFQDVYLKISELLDRLPEEIEISDFIYSEEEVKNISADATPIVVEPCKIARYYFDTRLYEPFFRELEQLDKLVNKSIVECMEAKSLLKFRLENRFENVENSSLLVKETSDFLNKISKQVSNEKTELLSAIERLKFKADEMVKNAISPLYAHSIIQAEKNISTLLREHKGKKFSIGFLDKIKSLKGEVNDLVVYILYRSSGEIIQAKKYLSANNESRVGVRQILDVAEKEKPEQKVFSQIPVFYRTLFSSKSLINDDLWVPMEKETAAVKSAIQRHKNGSGGAVLITGVHGSGKTALTRYCLNHYFKKDHVYTINAPVGGTVNIEDWLSELRLVVGKGDSSSEIFSGMPHDSFVVINDLELWWERSKEGCAVLEEIMEMIRIFGRKVFFMMNTNSYSFNQMNKAFPMEDNFLSIVECSPFDTKKLQLLIQRRHKTSGLNYIYRNKNEESVSPIKTASLFHYYFNYSDGVPGVAINAWIKNINRIVNQDIYVSKPEQPDVETLSRINPDWLIVIALFIQHKNMGIDKLARVMGISGAEAENTINTLLNAGILEMKEKDVFTIGRYLEPFLVKISLDKGII